MDNVIAIAPEFSEYVLHNAPLTRLATGFRWIEGPVWFGDAGCLLFSDIPNDRILRWTPPTGLGDGTLSIYRQPSNYANGHTRDLSGRLISCQHSTRSVTRTEHDGTITTLADQFDGKRLNSPNDVIVKSDGSIWFSDPHYGIKFDYEGTISPQEVPCQVYRIDPHTFEIEAMLSDFGGPNGLAFSTDEKKLYVVDTGAVGDENSKQHIRVFDVAVDGKSLSGGAEFFKVDAGVSDGIRLDSNGNIWSSATDGVHCISPQGNLLGKILVPEAVSNVCFGGRGKAWLYITASTSIYCIFLNCRGVQRP